MSITFYFAGDEVEETIYPCMLCDEGAPRPTCSECSGTGVWVSKSDKHEVNMSNSNALSVMQTLKMSPNSCGQITPKKLSQHICIFNAMGDHTLTPDQREYVEGRAAQLHQLAIAATQAGVEHINWG